MGADNAAHVYAKHHREVEALGDEVYDKYASKIRLATQEAMKRKSYARRGAQATAEMASSIGANGVSADGGSLE